jgi:hypothetical protein
MTDDVLATIEDALRALPRDPARCTVQHLTALAELQQALARYSERLRESMLALEEHTRDPDDADLQLALRERARLDQLDGRLRAACATLDTFTADALKAHGINPATLSVGD